MPTSTLAILWTIAAVEGFSTLAVEVIAIRLATPVVGSSVTLTGVMLGVVLLALSAGYWRGGSLSAKWTPAQTRVRLAANLLIAAALYGALAFPWEATLLEKLLDFDFGLAVSIGATATLIFLAPIYLASQTVPMLAELTNTEGKAGKASGKVLFFSTLGSVAGGIVTPVWLFPHLGVVNTTHIVCILLVAAAGVMAIGHLGLIRALGYGAAALAAVVTARALMPHPGDLFAFDSAYQSVRITEDKTDDGRTERVLEMGGGRASGIYSDSGETSFIYARYVEEAVAGVRPETVLVVGAAGFTIPRDLARTDTIQRIDAVDVDPSVKPITEHQFLRARLSPKIRFLPLSARYAVRRLKNDRNHYGFTLLDAYFGQGIPDELATVEFFRDVKAVSEHTVANVIMDRALESDFATNLLASFREAFGGVWVKDTKPGDAELSNMLLASWPAAGFTEWNDSGEIYRDNKNAADRDHVNLIWNTGD